MDRAPWSGYIALGLEGDAAYWDLLLQISMEGILASAMARLWEERCLWEEVMTARFWGLDVGFVCIEDVRVRFVSAVEMGCRVLVASWPSYGRGEMRKRRCWDDDGMVGLRGRLRRRERKCSGGSGQ